MALCRQCSARCGAASGPARAAAGTGVVFDVKDGSELYKTEVNKLNRVDDDEKDYVDKNFNLKFAGKLAVLTFLNKIRDGGHHNVGIQDIMDLGIIDSIQKETRKNSNIDSDVLAAIIFEKFDQLHYDITTETEDFHKNGMDLLSAIGFLQRVFHDKMPQIFSNSKKVLGCFRGLRDEVHRFLRETSTHPSNPHGATSSIYKPLASPP
jgi:hypothetical protein